MKARALIASAMIGAAAIWSVPAHCETAPAPKEQMREKFLILGDAPLDQAVDFSSVRMAELYRDASRENISLIRMLEGGAYNINIRHAANVTPDDYGVLTHADTIDVWIVEQGSGTLITGGEMVDGRHTGGVERFIGVGDVIFIPAGVPHGMKEAVSITWLNIRFPEHRN